MTSHETGLPMMWDIASAFRRTGGETRAVCQRQGRGSCQCGKCLAVLNCETYRDLDLCTVTTLSDVPVSKAVPF